MGSEMCIRDRFIGVWLLLELRLDQVSRHKLELMLSLPDVPYDKRTFKFDNQSFATAIKGSSDRRHAKAPAGKYPQRLFGANLEEPSARKVPVNKYRSFNV